MEQRLAALPQPHKRRLKQVLGKAVTGGRETQAVIDMTCEDERHKICDFVFFFFKLEFIDRNIMSWREMEESESRWQELWRSFLFILVGVGGQQAL